MKTSYLLLVLLSLSFFACEKEVELEFENPLNVERNDEVIVLTRAELSGKTEIPEGKAPVFKTAEDVTVPSQMDDLDGDGKWDELVLVLDFLPTQKIELELNWVEAADYRLPEKRTNLRLGITQSDGTHKEVDTYEALPCHDGFEVISQAEGVTWENDKIGFRIYFDCRNVKDLFGKLKPVMVADDVHTPGFGSYHDLADWGMDVLHCGSSLGAGGLALLRNDSLFRLGSTDVYRYQKIKEGPLRSIFELQYEGWDVDGEMLECVERITIYPGKYWFESDVTVKGCNNTDQIVTGIVTSHLKRDPFAFKAGAFQCIGTHDVQSLNNDELGMAVMVPQNETGKIGRTTDINFFKLGYKTVPPKGFSHIISETYYVGQECDTNVPAKHYFFSVWGLDKEQWKTEEGFKTYLKEEAEKLSAPIKRI
jgi:hypothetical protein